MISLKKFKLWKRRLFTIKTIIKSRIKYSVIFETWHFWLNIIHYGIECFMFYIFFCLAWKIWWEKKVTKVVPQISHHDLQICKMKIMQHCKTYNIPTSQSLIFIFYFCLRVMTSHFETDKIKIQKEKIYGTNNKNRTNCREVLHKKDSQNVSMQLLLWHRTA